MPKVLIIESDEGARYLYGIALRFQNLEVETASTMHAGLKLVPGFRPDLLLFDQMVPDFNSVNLLAKLEAEVPDNMPTIIATNLSDKEHKENEEVKVLKAFEYLASGKHTVGDVIRSARKAIGI
jgi:two-component system OmpR family response regulator